MPDTIPALLSKLRFRPGLWLNGQWKEDGAESIMIRNPATGADNVAAGRRSSQFGPVGHTMTE